MKIETLELAGLTAHVVGPATASHTVVLLHGFGAPGTDLVSLAHYLGAPARFVFPEAPLELGGLYGDARAWWLLDLERLERELQSGAIRDRRTEIPDGLVPAREQLSRFLDALQRELGFDDAHLVLGGFSQGAMLTVDVALHRERPLAALVLMSGTLLAESVWTPRMPRLANIPIVQSHGRHDMLLPFSVAEILRDQLVAAGATVDFVPFTGGHEIPPPVLDRVSALLRLL